MKGIGLAAAVLAVTSGLSGATLPAGFTDTAFPGLSSPTAMAPAPDGRLFVCEQGGRMRVIKNGALLPTPFFAMTVESSGERGLLGVAFDPNFLLTQYVYVYYTVVGSPPHNRLSRFTANGDVVLAGSELILLELPALTTASNHNGGAIHFGADGKLYVAVGDNADGANSQSPGTLKGKILRVGVPPDPLIPADNPFLGQTSGDNRAIWAMGLRNPFTFGIQPGTGRIFVNDVGENTWEEINDADPGDNFGWPTCEGDCNNGSFEDPFFTYNHTGGACSIAGGDFYDPEVPQFPALYVGKYFFADYCGNYIKYVDPGSGSPTATTFATSVSQPVDIRVGYDGAFYYLERNNGSGIAHRVVYTGSNAPSITQDPESQLVSTGHPVTFAVSATGQAPLQYQWQRNNADIGLATLSSYTIASVGPGDNLAQFRCIVSNGSGNATSNPAILTVTSNQPPSATIGSPAHGTPYAGGNVIAYSGTATDPETGALSGGAFTWWVNFHHDTHFHPFLPPTSGSASGAITIPTLGETSANVWYRIHLQVVDPAGLTDEKFVDVIPRTSTLTLTTNPNGLQLTLDGQPFTSPLDVVGVEGVRRTIGAPSPQSSGGNTYTYVSWSDAGLQTHDVFTPASDTTYTALFTSGPTPTFTRTNTPSLTRTPSSSPTFTATATATRTATATATPTFTASRTPTWTATTTFTATRTPSWTATSTFTASRTPSLTPTASFTATATFTSSATASATPTRTATGTASRTPTQTSTASVTPSLSPTATRTVSPSATITATATATATASPTRTASVIATATPTATVTGSATASRTPTQTASATPTASVTASRTLTSTPSRTATGSATPSRTPTSTASSTPTFSATPSRTATQTPSLTPTASATSSPTATSTATRTPTVTPALPTVSSLAPASGPAVGGTGISVGGSSFQPGAALRLGGVPAVSVTVVDTTQITGQTPALPAGTLNDLTVTNPGGLPATFGKAWFADFVDVPQANPFHADIETVFRGAISGGCGAGQYCPASFVTRAQMAVFLLKGKHGGAYVPPACAGTVFADVPCPGGPYVDWVNALAAEGITGGCGGGNYCPASPLSRAQMAVLLLRAEHGSGYTPPACSATVFADVPCPGGVFVDWINQLAAEGITSGCGAGNYCPAAATPRQQMATFLVRTFGLSPLATRPAIASSTNPRPRLRQP